MNNIILRWLDSFIHWREVLDLLFIKLDQILIIYRHQNDLFISFRKDIKDIQWQITTARDELKRHADVATTKLITSEISQTLVTVPKAVYTIVEEHNPSTVWGLLDLSDLHNGDEVELTVFMKLDNMPYKPFTISRYIGIQQEPIVQFLPRPTRGFKVEIKQTGGVSRDIHYYWQWTKS